MVILYIILDFVCRWLNYRFLYADRIFLVISLLNLIVDFNFVISSDIELKSLAPLIFIQFFPKLVFALPSFCCISGVITMLQMSGNLPCCCLCTNNRVFFKQISETLSILKLPYMHPWIQLRTTQS